MSLKNTNHLAEQLLDNVRKKQDYTDILNHIGSLKYSGLLENLNSNAKKNAFWINIYNAFFQIIRQATDIDKSKVYTTRTICIAGVFFSLDDIEHGILRRYRYKKSLGYLPNLWASKSIKKLAVSAVDYRIHFALNCGAISCPPIRFYVLSELENQLNLATQSFLKQETDIDPISKTVHVTRLFLWFLGDFGGRKGIRRILNEQLNFNSNGYKLIFKPYNWDEQLDNFINN